MEYNNSNFMGEMLFRGGEGKSLGNRAPIRLCRDNFWCDLSGDFVLPEYLPEIRKLLRVNARVCQPSKYLSAAAVKLSGMLEYSILYVGADGAIYSFDFPSEYEINAPFVCECDYDVNGGLEVGVDVSPESIVSRVTGARKLNIKSRICARVKVAASAVISDVGAIPNDEHLQKLVGTSECIFEHFGENQDIEIVDEFDIGAENERYVSTDCRVFVESVGAFAGYAECRGTVTLRHLISKGNQSVYGLPHKISFSEVVEMNDCSPEMLVSAFGRCTQIVSNTQEDDSVDGKKSVSVSARIRLDVRGFKKESISYVKDAYSTEYECANEWRSREVMTLYASANRNMSLNETLSIEALGNISEPMGVSIADVSADAVADEVVVCDSGRYAINGKCRFNVIYSQTDPASEGEYDDLFPEYSSVDIEVPFRYECSESGDAPTDFEFFAEAINPRVRCDGERLDVGCELAIAFAFFGEKQIEAVETCRLLEQLPKTNRGFTVCYPDSASTLWSISKKYKATVSETAAKNDIRLENENDYVKALDGIRYMIV